MLYQKQEFALWVCPECGRTVECNQPSTWQPNTTCGPHYDDDGKSFYVQMKLVYGSTEHVGLV